MLRALADETRFSIYQQLVAATGSIGANDLAERLGLHANTVRLHLERMRDAGLVSVTSVHRGTVGRPQHVYALVAGAPGVGLDETAHVVLSGVLGALAERAGAGADLALEVGRSWGAEVSRRTRSRSCVEALAAELDRLGFDPGLVSAAGKVSMAFRRCPFRDTADAYPELVCNVHRGICEGIVEEIGGGTVEGFTTEHEHEPCRITVAVGTTDRD